MKDGARIRTNVAVHQEKEKNEKTIKRKAGEERRQSTDFKEAAYCPSAVVQAAAWQKNGLSEGSTRGNWDHREGQQPFRPNSNGVGDRTTTLRRLLIGAVQFCSLDILYVRQKFRSSLFRKISQYVFWGRTEGPY